MQILKARGHISLTAIKFEIVSRLLTTALRQAIRSQFQWIQHLIRVNRSQYFFQRQIYLDSNECQANTVNTMELSKRLTWTL